MPAVDALLIGRASALGPEALPSGIAKVSVAGRQKLNSNGFVGDEQGDLRHHGGPDKAVHHYPSEHYAAWRKEIGDLELLHEPGAFGENLATRGLTESDVAIGDRFRFGTSLVEVTQGRQPCFRLNLRFERPDMAVTMQNSGRTGWYYRVIEPGMVARGDQFDLVERLSPAWTIERLWRLFYIDVLDRDGLREMASVANLPERWRAICEARLSTGLIEDWQRRLTGA